MGPLPLQRCTYEAGSIPPPRTPSATLNPVVHSRNFLENAPYIHFLHFLALVPNSPFSTSWDYLLNEPPAPQSLSHCLLRGTLLGYVDLLMSYSPTPCTALCPTAQAPLGMAGPLGASCLTCMLCPYKLLHGSWVTCLESQSPTWTPSYLEVIISGNSSLVCNHIHLLPQISFTLNPGHHDWGVNDFLP